MKIFYTTCCTTTLVRIAGGRKGYAIIKRIVCAKGRDSEDPKVLHFSRHANFTFLFVDWENSRKERDTFPAGMYEFSIVRQVDPAHFHKCAFEDVELFSIFPILFRNFKNCYDLNISSIQNSFVCKVDHYIHIWNYVLTQP